LFDRKTLRRRGMTQPASSFAPALDYSATIIGALELSGKSWVLAVQLPGALAEPYTLASVIPAGEVGGLDGKPGR
jgi:hypothetical protein